MVDAHDKHGRVLARRGDDDAGGATLEVEAGLLEGGEDAGGLDDGVDAAGAPGDGGGVALVEHLA